MGFDEKVIPSFKRLTIIKQLIICILCIYGFTLTCKNVYCGSVSSDLLTSLNKILCQILTTVSMDVVKHFMLSGLRVEAAFLKAVNKDIDHIYNIIIP